jgi:hypothetical protein
MSFNVWVCGILEILQAWLKCNQNKLLVHFIHVIIYILQVQEADASLSNSAHSNEREVLESSRASVQGDKLVLLLCEQISHCIQCPHESGSLVASTMLRNSFSEWNTLSSSLCTSVWIPSVFQTRVSS